MIKLRKQILDGNKIMSDLSNQDLQAYFQMGNTGFWKLEIETNKPKRMFTDDLMNACLGVDDAMSPEDKYVFFSTHVYIDDAKIVAACIEEMQEHESEVIHRYMHPNKGLVYMRLSGRRILAQANRIEIVGTYQEEDQVMHFESDKLLENYLVQQNQQLRDEKQLSDFYYRDLLDLASCGILMYTLPGYQIVHMNKEAMRIYGLKNFEQAQKEFGQIVSNVEYFDANAKEKLAHLREHNGAVDYTCIIHGLQGEQIPILARTVSKETLGQETAVITTFLDISENLYLQKEIKRVRGVQNKLERTLAESQKNAGIIITIAKLYQTVLYENFVTNTYEIITSKNGLSNMVKKKGKITDMSIRLVDLMIAPEMVKRMKRFVDRNTLSKRLRKVDSIWEEYKNSKGKWYRCGFIVKKRDVQGNVIEIVYVSREVTKEKLQEIQYQNELEKKAKEAKNANDAKTNFLRRMSHDIRTPINGICGMVEVSEYYKDDLEKQAECREKIRNAAHLLLELVNEVLDMGKLESGEINLEHVPFNIGKTYESVLDIMEKLAKERDIEIICNGEGIEHWDVIGSPIHVKRIFMNFMSNAIKYNKEHGKLFLKGKELSFDGKTAWIEFTFQDTGVGMSKEFQKHIFEPFTQDAYNSHAQYNGTGLGLSIAKALVEKMGGFVAFSSELGKGTTFVITIPFQVNTPIHVKNETDVQKSSIQGLNILLVEDNDLNMEFADFVLLQSGANVTKAWNGKEAVEIFKKVPMHSFNVVLMDIMMPVLDGYAATKAIRHLNREDAQTIPIIAMTANAFMDDKLKAKAVGMNGHVSKPINPELLINTILENKHD